MDNKIIEELEIIIRAQVESARRDIKKVAKDSKAFANSVIKDLKNINKADLEKFKKNIKTGAEEVKKIKDEIREIEIFDGNVSFKVKADFSDFDKKSKEAYSKLASEDATVDVVTNKVTNEVTNSTTNTAGSAPIKVEADTSQAEADIYSLQERLNDFNALTIKEQLVTVGMQIEQLIPPVAKVRMALQSAFKGLRVNDAIDGWRMGIDAVNQKTSTIKAVFSDAMNSVKNKLAPVTSTFKNVGTIGKNVFTEIKANIKESADTAGTPLNRLKTLISKIREVGKETDKAKKKGKSFGTDFGKSLSKGIGSIKRFALSLLSIRSAFSAISKASQAYLSFDTELQESIQNSWNVLGSLLAPILEYVASLFSQLVSAVATFVKALTGIDLVAKANAKSLKKQEEATKKASSASKSLSGIDDIDTLSSGTSGGEEPQTITIEPVNIKPLQDFLNKAKTIFSQVFAPFKDAWDKTGKTVIDSMKNSLSNLADFGSSILSSIFEVWTNGTGLETMTIIFEMFSSILDIISQIALTLSDAWNQNNIGTQTIQNVWNGFNNLLAIIKSVFDTFSAKWNEIGKPICDTFMKLVKDLSDKFNDLTDKFKEIWDDGGQYLFEKVLELGTKIIEIAGWIYEQFVSPFISWFIDEIVPAMNPLFKALGNIIDIGLEIVDFIKNVFTGNWAKAFENIKGIISGAWNFIKNIFSAGGKIFVGIVDGIASAFKTMVNAIISGINRVIKVPFDVVNGLLNKIRNCNIPIIDVKPFKGLWDQNPLPVPQIPQLATGNVATEPLIAQFGEYPGAKSNPEVTSPVSIMKDSFRAVLNEFDFGGTRVDRIVVNVAGENFYDDTIDYINDKSERLGVSVIKEM